MEQSTSLLIFFAAILVFAGLIFVLITMTKNAPRQLNVEQYRTKWMQIEQQLTRSNMDSLPLAILNADKLLDQALRERGISGNSMADRMKNFQKSWSNANAVWGAHKLRNRIAHDADVHVDYESARRALSSFKQALKDTGAI